MRTTVRLDESLMADVKRLAVESGQTMTAVIETSLRETLARRRGPTKKGRVRLPTFRGDGVRSGVNLNSSAALLDLIEGRPGPA
jgi:hypothetical protein